VVTECYDTVESGVQAMSGRVPLTGIETYCGWDGWLVRRTLKTLETKEMEMLETIEMKTMETLEYSRWRIKWW